MVTTKNNGKQKAPPRDATLPVPSEVRVLADEAMALGDYGTLTNTLKVSLRDQIQRLKASRQSQSVAT